jgi:hypothetical protein
MQRQGLEVMKPWYTGERAKKLVVHKEGIAMPIKTLSS